MKTRGEIYGGQDGKTISPYGTFAAMFLLNDTK